MNDTNTAAQSTQNERTKWEELRAVIQDRWSELTHDDIDKLKGQVNRLVDLVQERYGVTLEDAKRQVSEFEQTIEGRVGTMYRNVSGTVSTRYRTAREGVNEFADDVRNFGLRTTVADLARHYPIATFLTGLCLGAAIAGGSIRSRRRRWY